MIHERPESIATQRIDSESNGGGRDASYVCVCLCAYILPNLKQLHSGKKGGLVRVNKGSRKTTGLTSQAAKQCEDTRHVKLHVLTFPCCVFLPTRSSFGWFAQAGDVCARDLVRSHTPLSAFVWTPGRTSKGGGHLRRKGTSKKDAFMTHRG